MNTWAAINLAFAITGVILMVVAQFEKDGYSKTGATAVGLAIIFIAAGLQILNWFSQCMGWR